MGTMAVGDHTDRTRIGRQSIHDRSGAVVGYELLFRPGPGLMGADQRAQDRSLSEVITTAFGEFGLERFGAQRNLFVNMTRALLTGERAMPFSPQHVVLEVLEHHEVDAELVAGLRELKSRGYRIAIDGYVGGPEHARLLPLVDVVKVDIPAIGPDLDDLVYYIRETVPHAALMAGGVDDRVGLDACLAAGFDLLQGRHYQRPTRAHALDVGPSQVISLQLLAALADVDRPVVDLERIVSADPGLSLRVLNAVNSAAGAGQALGSLRQAIVLLGRRSLSAWVLLAALAGHPGSRREDMIDVLTRAKICELLSEHLEGVEPATAYAGGLLSGVIEVMGADPKELAQGMRLNEDLTAALVHRQGHLGLWLDAIDEFDRTGQAPEPISTRAMSYAHLRALGEAVDTIDSILLGSDPWQTPEA